MREHEGAREQWDVARYSLLQRRDEMAARCEETSGALASARALHEQHSTNAAQIAAAVMQTQAELADVNTLRQSLVSAEEELKAARLELDALRTQRDSDERGRQDEVRALPCSPAVRVPPH